MSTSRQRACLINSPGWIRHLQLVKDFEAEQEYAAQLRAEKRERKKIEDAEKQQLNQRANTPKIRTVSGVGTMCMNKGCNRVKGDRPQEMADKKKPFASWRKCPGKGCRKWACGDPTCFYSLQEHSAYCGKKGASVSGAKQVVNSDSEN